MARARRGLGNATVETVVSGAHRCIGFVCGFEFCMQLGSGLVSTSPASSSRRVTTASGASPTLDKIIGEASCGDGGKD